MGRQVQIASAIFSRQPAAANRSNAGRPLSDFSRRLAKTVGLSVRFCPGAHLGDANNPSVGSNNKPEYAGSKLVNLTSDQQIFWQYGLFKLNGTIVTTWALMFVMALGSKLITRKLATERTISRWQSALEIVVTGIEQQIKEVGLSQPAKYLSFLGTLFLFVATASICTLIPGYQPPTGSLSTTAALALCVFIAVPVFGIAEQGLGGYLKTYTKPTMIMLPFNIISELSRTLALAVRLFGNMMSGVMIVGILLTITPFCFRSS